MSVGVGAVSPSGAVSYDVVVVSGVVQRCWEQRGSVVTVHGVGMGDAGTRARLGVCVVVAAAGRLIVVCCGRVRPVLAAMFVL